jgi:catechol 2,3-dioxygenase-like lactoylglutathione lyase family enzyme
MSIAGFDHAAMPIERVDEMLAFYRRLGFRVEASGAHRYSVHFGANKINMHGPAAWRDASFTLRGPTAVPGCGDFCFVWNGSEKALTRMLADADAQVIEGPVVRMGGRDDGAASGTSIYVRDPDSNLLEFIVYSDP